MTDAFSATFSDFRIIRGRKIASIVLEVPLEQADAALAVLGGVPNPSAERWVAVARLKDAPARVVPKRERLTSERAAMLCSNAAFTLWLRNQQCAVNFYTAAPADLLRGVLSIQSRAELDTDPEARKRFEALESEFHQHTGRMAHVR